MSRYLADSVPLDAINSYQLSCVVRHHGEGVRSGHYLCDISDGDGWKRCDDSIIAAALKVIRTEIVLSNVNNV